MGIKYSAKGHSLALYPYQILDDVLLQLLLGYLFGDRQALPKTPGKTEMVLRFPLGFV